VAKPIKTGPVCNNFVFVRPGEKKVKTFHKPRQCTAAIIYQGVLLFTVASYNAIWLDASHSCEPMKSQKARRGDLLFSHEGGSTLLLLPAANMDPAVAQNGLDLLENCT
jgi:hypothetical protein